MQEHNDSEMETLTYEDEIMQMEDPLVFILERLNQIIEEVKSPRTV